MRKFTFIFLITSFIFSVPINAQVKKGSVFLGGDIGGSTQKTKSSGTETNSQNSIVISPVFGKAIKENLILGGFAGFNLYENNNTGASPTSFTDQRQAGYSGGIFLRKYKPIAKSAFSIFLHSSLGVNYNSVKYENPPTYLDNRKRYSIGISAYPGVSYAINKRLQLETGFNNLINLNYFTEKRDIQGSTTPYSEKTTGFGVSTSLNNFSSLYLGFRVLINK